MTRNQQRSLSLARAIVGGTIDAIGLSEHDWHLLLLAAGLNKVHSDPLRVCRRVLDRAGAEVGYFQDMKRVPCQVGRPTEIAVAIGAYRENTYITNGSSPKHSNELNPIHLQSRQRDKSDGG